MKQIKVNIRYGYENPFLSVCIENPQSERFSKVKDMEHFNLWCAAKKALRDKGAFVRIDKGTKERYKCLSQYNGYGSWERLEFSTEIYTTGLKFEFFQNSTKSENKNGGKFDFDKYKKFPYLLKLRLKLAIKTLIEALLPICESTITFTDDPKISADRILKRRSECGRNVKTLDDIQSSMCEYDFAYNHSKDRDKKEIKCGEIKYFYDYDGYIHRGLVYHNSNSMWWVIENKLTLRSISSFNLFDRTDEPIRRELEVKEKIEKLIDERNRQIKAENFIRCNAIQKIINKLKLIK